MSPPAHCPRTPCRLRSGSPRPPATTSPFTRSANSRRGPIELVVRPAAIAVFHVVPERLRPSERCPWRTRMTELRCILEEAGQQRIVQIRALSQSRSRMKRCGTPLIEVGLVHARVALDRCFRFRVPRPSRDTIPTPNTFQKPARQRIVRLAEPNCRIAAICHPWRMSLRSTSASRGSHEPEHHPGITGLPCDLRQRHRHLACLPRTIGVLQHRRSEPGTPPR